MLMNNNVEENYWTTRYRESQTGWDVGRVSTPLKAYIDQLNDKELKILIPGAGNAYEAAYLWNIGFKNVHVLDISKIPLEALKQRIPDFPQSQLMHGNFFEHEGEYDLIIEQTFFCSFLPTQENRNNYAFKMAELIKPAGKLVGLWFNHPLTDEENRPFGGSREEYLNYFSPHFDVQTFEPAHNSIEQRQGRELFGIFVRK